MSLWTRPVQAPRGSAAVHVDDVVRRLEVVVVDAELAAVEVERERRQRQVGRLAARQIGVAKGDPGGDRARDDRDGTRPRSPCRSPSRRSACPSWGRPAARRSSSRRPMRTGRADCRRWRRPSPSRSRRRSSPSRPSRGRRSAHEGAHGQPAERAEAHSPRLLRGLALSFTPLLRCRVDPVETRLAPAREPPTSTVERRRCAAREATRR